MLATWRLIKQNHQPSTSVLTMVTVILAECSAVRVWKLCRWTKSNFVKRSTIFTPSSVLVVSFCVNKKGISRNNVVFTQNLEKQSKKKVLAEYGAFGHCKSLVSITLIIKYLLRPKAYLLLSRMLALLKLHYNSSQTDEN